MKECNDLEKKTFYLNAGAMNALFCALDKNEFNQISMCEMAFNIWHTLEITHEGTSRVKDSKINLLMHNFDYFEWSYAKPLLTCTPVLLMSSMA